MSKKYYNIADQLNTIAKSVTNNQPSDINGTSQSQVVGLLAAHAIASNLPIPSSPLGNNKAMEYYMENLHDGVLAELNEINKQSTLTMTVAERAAREFWMARYAMVHVPLSYGSLSLYTNVLMSEDKNRGWSSSVARDTIHQVIHGSSFSQYTEVARAMGDE